MTKPTKAQLAPNVDPLLRDYIDACIYEAIEKAKLSRRLQGRVVEETLAATTERLAKVNSLEREVRSHLGIYKEE